MIAAVKFSPLAGRDRRETVWADEEKNLAANGGNTV
jgi:hypothetical protein